MKKRILSLVMVLVLCLTLLPVTALAAEEIKLFIGGQQITESGCYANQNGTWTKVEGTGPSSGQFYYDAATFTLTLNQAEITHDRTVKVAEGYTYEGSVIAFSQTADVSLKIVVSQGTSTITGTGGIRVESTTGNASLSIKGSGSLDVEPKGSNSGITLCSSKNTNLDIDGADVTASSPAQYGVYLISSTDTTSTSTITVNNGSLTTGGNGNVGIYYYWSGTSNAGTSSLTVSGNAVVDTRNSQIMAQNKETVVQVGAGSDGNGGIVFNGKNGTVYGDVTLDENLTIGKDETLTIPDNSSLNSNGNLTNNGTIINNGTLTGEVGGSGTVTPKITTESPLPNGTVGTAYSQKLTANGTAPITWSCSDLPAWLKLDSSTGVISGIPNAAGTYNFTVTAANDSGSDSKELTLKINAVSVSDVTLDKTELSLYVGNTETLNVTVKPNNATNKNVIWKSSNEKVATVENGKVTAKAPGKAIITVTTIDGSKTATCEVTVVRKNSGIIIIPPTTNGNWRQTPIGWWYQNPDGTYPANQWRYLDSGKGYKAWYWFNQYGYMTTGWQKVGNTWYYMNRSGEMQTGWVFVNSQWYYLNSSGAMLTGWVYDGGKWYYMNKDGSMHFGWLSWAGYWYHLDSHGAMSTGWKQVNGKWYYMYAENGRMAANTTTPDGYRVGADGAWIR